MAMDTQETQWPESMNPSLLQKMAKVAAKKVASKKVVSKKVAAKKVSEEAVSRNEVYFGQTPDIGKSNQVHVGKENCINGLLFDEGVTAASTMFEGGEEDDVGQGKWQETQWPDMDSEKDMSMFL